VVVLVVILKVLVEIAEAFSDEGDLHLGGSGVTVVDCVRLDDGGLLIVSERHLLLPLRFPPLAVRRARRAITPPVL
jgi:hypothetical protein